MAVTFTTTVACDGPGCTRQFTQTHDLRYSSMLERRTVLRLAVDAGWQVAGAEHFCEFHREAND